MQSVTANGQKVSARIRQALYDPLNVEAFMYMGPQVVPMYARELKRSTWSQLEWICLQAASGECDNEIYFDINGMRSNMNAMDYLLAISMEVTFPQITLENTKAPCCYKYAYVESLGENNSSYMLMNGILNKQMYFYASDGRCGLPDKTVYVGSSDALGQLGVYCHAKPLAQLSERHKVSWGHHAALAAVEGVSFMIDGVEYEDLSNHAIYNAQEQRFREDIYPIAGIEATSLPCYEITANQDTQSKAILGSDCDDLYRAFVAPFSFTTSAMTDRGENGKFKSAFPIMLCCKNNVQIKAKTINDIRNALVLQREVLRSYHDYGIKFVATASELGNITTPPTQCNDCGTCNECELRSVDVSPNLYFSCGGVVYKIYNCNFSNTKVCGNNTLYLTGSSLKFSLDNEEAKLISDPKVGALCLGNIDSACRWETVTRPCDSDHKHDSIQWNDWICGSNHKVAVKARALGAIVTMLERGMMKADCRGKKLLYEKYDYFDSCDVKPGTTAKFQLNEIPGAFKYAYTFAQNKTSSQQGQHFNYTNDTDYSQWKDNYNHNFSYVFEGKSAISEIGSRIQGYRDVDAKSTFYRCVDGPLCSQRAPRRRGLFVTPRYCNWMNAIYPDGSVNPQAINSITLAVKTAKSGVSDHRLKYMKDCDSCVVEHGSLDSRPNTFEYNVQCIAVSWNLAIFDLIG